MKIITLLCLNLITMSGISHGKDNGASTVLVTLPPLSGLVVSLDAQINVQCLLPNSADPHHFQLSPKQVDNLQHARLLIRSPRDDKFWPYFDRSIPTLSLWQPSKHIHHEQNHAWLNPQEVSNELPKLGQQLIKTFPEHKKNIDAQLTAALNQSQEIWQQWQITVEKLKLKQRGVIMQHPSWQGLFEALGVPVRAVLESAQHGQEQGPRKLEHALSVLKEHPQTLLIADAHHSNRSLDWLKKHSPTSHIITLDALGKCGQAWPKLMQHNLDILAGHKP